MKVSVTFLILGLFILLLEANPGIKVKITQKALDYGEYGRKIWDYDYVVNFRRRNAPQDI